VTAHPRVLDEWETLRLIREKGWSLARLGDGEAKVCEGKTIKSQPYHPELSARMRETLRSKDRNLLVAVPRIWPPLPVRMPRQKRLFWAAWEERFLPWLRLSKGYGSAFVSRPDSAPGIDCAEYWALMRSLWEGREVLAVYGGKFDEGLLDNAMSVTHQRAPEHDAWADYPRIKRKVLAWAATDPADSLIVAFLGPTATILAADCSAAGVQCLDLGASPRFYRDFRKRHA
jgi:hypothetical protein